MDLGEAQYLAITSLNEFGLIEQGWRFEWSRAKTSYGTVYYSCKLLQLSKPLTAIGTYEQVNDTVLHEIAHCLAGPEHRHDKVWWGIARLIGCDGTIYGTKGNIPGKYQYRCKKCGYTARFHRPLKHLHLRYHGACGKEGRFVRVTNLDYPIRNTEE